MQGSAGSDRPTGQTITAVNVVGARPNFMKIAPVQRAMMASGVFEPHLVHTGQHYEVAMSRVFFDDLGLPEPSITLDIGSGTHAEQTARVMLALEPVLLEIEPDVVLVVGDVNSTLAGALTAAKLNIPLAHVEAGLRSGDRSMPEEINRLVTDAVAELLFAPSEDAVENLRAEGLVESRIHLVGNVMIDSLDTRLARARQSSALERLGLLEDGYLLATLHRPANVDSVETLTAIVSILNDLATLKPLLFVVHPRTADRLQKTGLGRALEHEGIVMTGPMGYIDFLAVLSNCSTVLTDSGGIQEESTVLGIPCVTLRDTTERPITLTQGTNRVVGLDPEVVSAAAREAIASPRAPHRPPFWDGHASERIIDVLRDRFAEA